MLLLRRRRKRLHLGITIRSYGFPFVLTLSRVEAEVSIAGMERIQLPSGKRPREAEQSAARKRKRGALDRTSEVLDDVVYRILCPASRIGSVIGKGGCVISSVREETGARIKVADGAPGAEERVIYISCSSKFREKRKHAEDGRVLGEDTVPPQEALLKVFAKIVERNELEDGAVTTRLLVPNSQIGCLLGKGGKIIEQMRIDTGAQIKILPKNQLPPFASESDELVQLSGDVVLVRSALSTISTRLYQNPPRDRPSQVPVQEPSLLPPLLHHPGAFFSQTSGLFPGQQHINGFAPSVAPVPWQYASASLPVVPATDGELVLRLLCPKDRVGSVIGKQGKVIRNIREETSAYIKVSEADDDSDERVIIVSANESLHNNVSPSLKAILQLQNHIADSDTSTARMLVPSSSIGCLIGKKGGIINEMRKNTRANIRVLSKELLPSCALEDDELVQITGNMQVLTEAITEIVARLRVNLLQEHKKPAWRKPDAQGRASSSYDGRHEPSPVLLPPSSTMGTLHSSISSPSHSSRDLQGAFGGGAPTQLFDEFGRRPSGGFITSVSATTVELSIPCACIGAVIGRDGCNLPYIRQISGANVKLHDQHPGSDKRVIEISGTPEQAFSAQKILEALTLTLQPSFC